MHPWAAPSSDDNHNQHPEGRQATQQAQERQRPHPQAPKQEPRSARNGSHFAVHSRELPGACVHCTTKGLPIKPDGSGEINIICNATEL